MRYQNTTIDYFKHVIQILDIGTSSELERVLQIEGIHSTRHLLQMIDDVLNNITYKKGDTKLKVPRFQIASLRLFIEHCKYRTKASDPVENFQLLTQDELDDFNLKAPVIVTTPIPGSSTYPPPISDPAMKEFNRGIKRNPNHFQTFSNKRNWSDYKDHTIATGNSQNIEDIFDPTFVPINGDTRELFMAKQRHLFQVLATILKMIKERNLLSNIKTMFMLNLSGKTYWHI